jgi:hypothetical protein
MAEHSIVFSGEPRAWLGKSDRPVATSPAYLLASAGSTSDQQRPGLPRCLPRTAGCAFVPSVFGDSGMATRGGSHRRPDPPVHIGVVSSSVTTSARALAAARSVD